LSQAVEQIAPRAAASRSEPGKIEPMASNEQERLVELHRWPLLDPELKPLFDRAALDLAQAFNVPMVLVSLIDEEREVWISQAGFAEEREEAREISPAAQVVARNDLLVIEDVEKDTRLGSGGFSRQHGIRFYAGAPLRTRANLPLGAISVMDAQPRNPTASELQLLEMIGRQLMEEAQLRLEQKDHPAAPASKSW
jgi:GAF domain-containing protein